MGNYKYLINVSDKNNNKYYELIEEDNGTFTVNYGRVDSTCTTTSYPMSLWDKKYNEKLKPRKGYSDITDLRSKTILVDTKNSAGDSIISHDKDVVNIIKSLQDYAKAHSAKVYNVMAVSVTQEQVDAAQRSIDLLTLSAKRYFGQTNWDMNLFNYELLRLFRTIPRKMKNVNDHLLSTVSTLDDVNEILSEEQLNLDTMASQVSSNVASNNSSSDDSVDVDDSDIKTKNTLLEDLGLVMELVTDDKELSMIKDRAENHKHRIIRAYKVINKNTEANFQNQVINSSSNKTEMFWHGSRSQNWWFILQQGLKIRPSGAIHTGSMFGDGIYYASSADKSMGYTDSGRWAGGGKNGSVFMGLYDVHIGNQYVTLNSDSSLSYDKIRAKGDYHSTWGKKGPSLYRNEFIVYRHDQSTIKYLVEFKD